ncbi:MAG: hypothetical protein Q8P53_03435 [Candidatus Shapirobacteria bacterium]|nr:hypothetical protein [Candidatus Shapirobacteria bacterium]
MAEILFDNRIAWEISKISKIKKYFKFFFFGLIPLYFLAVPFLIFIEREHGILRVRVPVNFNFHQSLDIYLIGLFTLISIFLIVIFIVYLFSPNESYIIDQQGMVKTINSLSKRYSWSDLIEFYSYSNLVDRKQCSIKNLPSGTFVKVNSHAIKNLPIFDYPIICISIKKQNTSSNNGNKILMIRTLPENFKQVIIFLSRKLPIFFPEYITKGLFSHFE